MAVPKIQPDHRTTRYPEPRASLDERVKQARERMAGLRPIEPLELLEVEPNRLTGSPPTPMLMAPTDLYVDGEYQRDLRRNGVRLILNIIQGFSWEKFKPPVVTLDDENRYVVIDGQHTAIAAASHPDITEIPVMYVRMKDVAAQAAAFVSHNTERVAVIKLDLFHARVKAGDPLAVEAKEILDHYGITLVRYLAGARDIAYDKNQTMATETILRLLAKYGRDRFKYTIQTIAECEFAPIRADHFRAVNTLLHENRKGEPEFSQEQIVSMLRSTSDAAAAAATTGIAMRYRIAKSKAYVKYYQNRLTEMFPKK